MDALYGFLIMQGYIMKQEYNRFSAVYTYVLFGFIFAFNSLIKRLGLVYLGGCFWDEVYDIICYTNKIKGNAYIQKGIGLNTFGKRVRRNENMKALFDRYVIYKLFFYKPQVFPSCNMFS